MNTLFLRAVFAVLLLPGVIGFAIPLLLIEPRWHHRMFFLPAVLPLAFGVSLLLGGVVEFYRAGKGTLAPWSPPVHLVTSGPYRFSRNPMYVAMSSLLIGWALGFRSLPLTWWAIFMIIAFHLRILMYEEPTLARLFGDEFHRYKSRAPRWLV